MPGPSNRAFARRLSVAAGAPRGPGPRSDDELAASSRGYLYSMWISGSVCAQPLVQTGSWRHPGNMAAGVDSCPQRLLGPVNTTGMVATGGHFAPFEEGRVTDTGCILATSDKKWGKWPPSLRVAAKSLTILRCRPRQWGRHSPRTPPRLVGFSLATPSIPVVLTGPRAELPAEACTLGR